MSDKMEEEKKLEAHLREVEERKYSVFESLNEIRKDEKDTQEKLHRIREDVVKRDQIKRNPDHFEAQLKAATQEASEIRVQVETLKTENTQLRAALNKKEIERTSSAPVHGTEMERQNFEQNESLRNVRVNLLQATSLPRTQEREKRDEEEIERLTNRIKSLEDQKVKQLRQINSLKDEISASRQKAAETQLRQLEENPKLAEENKELRQMLAELRCQQHQPAAQQHRPGKRCPGKYYLKTKTYNVFLYLQPFSR